MIWLAVSAGFAAALGLLWAACLSRAAAGKASVQETHVTIEEIANGVVRLAGDRYRAMVQVRGVNFDLLGPTEREQIVAGYAGFLNALTFPVQEVVRVLPIDLEDYIADLEARARGGGARGLAELAADQLAFVRGLARDRGLLERLGYVVVCADDGLGRRGGLAGLLGRRDARLGADAAARQLADRCDEVRRGLRRCDLEARRLGDPELRRLYRDCWRPSAGRRQRLHARAADHVVPAVTGEGGERWAS